MSFSPVSIKKEFEINSRDGAFKIGVIRRCLGIINLNSLIERSPATSLLILTVSCSKSFTKICIRFVTLTNFINQSVKIFNACIKNWKRNVKKKMNRNLLCVFSFVLFTCEIGFGAKIYRLRTLKKIYLFFAFFAFFAFFFFENFSFVHVSMRN